MSSDLAKGGRGKRAPYESTHYRLPVPLKPIAEEMAANYRELVSEYSDPQDPALIAAVLGAIAPSTKELEQDLDVSRDQLWRMQEYANNLAGTVAENLKQYQQMQSELEELQQRVEKFKGVNQAIAILTEALKLRANSGGAIKEQIREALLLLVA